MSMAKIADLPMGAKLAIVGAILALILVAAFIFGGLGVMLIFLAGFVFVALLLLGYRLVLARLDSKKANPFLVGLAANSGATPQGISDPSRRARLDDLNRAFGAGIERFKAAGKDLYALPWYMVVGEPGSGKTEAIRHSNIGFPPGMQDELQGSGGTLNMNWWFANQAVLLDTAGRLMFEEVHAGETSEWQEFLKLLRSNRAHCPINGMFLILPVDSLIKDTAEELEGKARRIATQLDSIQRVLGVRFPVFVLVTKCDLLNGFRETFEELSDPRQQHQMLGWSNPAPLDQPFDPSKVDEHFEEVIERLEQRRTTQLADPAPRLGPDAKRIDEVDALYAFPQSVASMLPRLRRYLELIFVTGEWSNKPLFLRGIYFTSSMRDGEALDAQLADVLGVPVDSLPEGRAWERERSYFLRDVFAEKAFRERGLVTRADSAEKLKRRRRAVVLGSACAVVVVLLTLTWIGGLGFRKVLGEPKLFWTELAGVTQEASDQELSALASDPPRSTNFVSRASDPFTTARFDSTVGTAGADLLPRMQRRLKVPAMFSVVAAFSADLESERLGAFRSLLDRTWLVPAVEATRRKMAEETDEPWNENASLALAELMRLETLAAGHTPDGARRGVIALEPLLRYAVSSDSEVGESVVTDAQAAIDFAYADGAAWPPETLGAATPASRRAIAAGIERFETAWSGGGLLDGSAGALMELVEASRAFEQSEAALLVDVGLGSAETREEYDQGVNLWRARYDTLKSARNRLASAVEAATRGGLDLDATPAEVVSGVRSDALDAFDLGFLALREQLPKTEVGLPGDLGAFQRRADELVEDSGSRVGADLEPGSLPSSVSLDVDPDVALIVNRLESAGKAIRSAVEDRLSEAESALAGSIGAVIAQSQSALIQDRSFEVRFKMFEAADSLLAARAERGDLEVGSRGIVHARDLVRDTTKELDRLRVARPDDAAFIRVRASLDVALATAQRALQTDALDALFDSLPDSSQDIALGVAKQAELLEQIQMPTIPMTMMQGGTFDRRYHPDAANALFRAWETALSTTRIADEGTPDQLLNHEAVLRRLRSEQAVMDGYLRLYVDYWTRRIPEMASAKSYEAWGAYREDLRHITVFEVIGTLGVYTQRVRLALDVLPSNLETGLARRVESVRVSLAAQSESLGNAAAENLWANAILTWIELGEDGARARESLLRLTPTQFRSRYLGAYKGSQGGGSPYFESVVKAGIRVLAGGSQSEAQAAFTRLTDDYRAFPLCTGVETQLGPEQMRAAAEDVRTLARLQAASPSSSAAAETIGEGAETIFEDVNTLLQRMTGGQVLNTQSERAWLGGVEQISQWLAPGGQGLTAELVILPYDQQPATDGVDRFRHMQVVRGAGALSMADGISEIPTNNARPQTGISVPVGRAGDVELQFRTVPSEGFVSVARLDGPWAMVKLLLDPEASLVEDEPGFEGVWRVPVLIVEPSGAGTDYWIGVRFSHPVPERSAWLDVSVWPSP